MILSRRQRTVRMLARLMPDRVLHVERIRFGLRDSPVKTWLVVFLFGKVRWTI